MERPLFASHILAKHVALLTSKGDGSQWAVAITTSIPTVLPLIQVELEWDGAQERIDAGLLAPEPLQKMHLSVPPTVTSDTPVGRLR